MDHRISAGRRRQQPTTAGVWLVAATLAIGLALAMLTSSGCNRATPMTPEAPPTAREVLDRMVAAYQKTKTYADSGQLRLSYRTQGGQPMSQAADYSVTFARPNKLRMHAYQAIVVCDGDKFRATVADLPGQVLEFDAPETLKREDLYLDEILTAVLTQGLAGESIQLALLLLPDPLVPILEGGEAPVLLDPQTVDGEECYRVEVKRPEGKVVLWIDQRDYALRKLAYPTDELKKQIAQAEQATVTEVSLVAELNGARLGDAVADVAFRFDAPESAKMVQRFQYQPDPLPRILGQKIGAFEFIDMSGKPVTRDALAGKVVVVDFWATWCSWCFKGLPNLQQVYDKYREDDRVAIVAVSTDEASVTPADLQATFDKASLSIPILRDAREHGRTMFGIQGLPTMFVLGADGSVQAVDVGYQPELAEKLPKVIDRLLAGENVAEQAQQEYQARLTAFEASLANGHQQSAEDGTIPQARIAPRSDPSSLKLVSLWHSDEAVRPGNILVVENATDGPSRLLVNDGWRNVVELDASGKLVARHALDIPADAAVSYLRTASDAQGRRFFAGTASAQQQLYLFDASFQRVLAFPEGQHTGISDVRLADLDGDGQVEMIVGYWGSVGVQCVSLTGERIWNDRSLDNVFCVAVTPPVAQHKRSLLAADGRGALVPIDAQGQPGSPISIPGKFLRWVAISDLDGDGQDDYCAIASIRAGVESAVGLSVDGRQLWDYELPVGAHPNAALEMVASGKLVGGQGQWILAGADGTIHILSADGKVVDQFALGHAIGGVAVATIDGRGALIVATDQGIDAWHLDAP